MAIKSRGEATGLGDYFQMWGFLMVAVGLALGGWAYFFFDPSYAAPEGLGVDRVANIDLMQKQLMIFIAGAASLVLGAIFLAAGNVIKVIGASLPPVGST